jgi:hypothetical protein
MGFDMFWPIYTCVFAEYPHDIIPMISTFCRGFPPASPYTATRKKVEEELKEQLGQVLLCSSGAGSDSKGWLSGL